MERFKRHWWTGWIRSSRGYSVRIVGKNDLQYVDEHRRINLFAEPLARYSDIAVDLSAMPELPEATRAEIVERLHRAFTFAGWTMIESEGRSGKS